MFVIEKDEMQVITVELKNEVNYLAFFLSWSQSVSVIDIFFKSTANNDNNHLMLTLTGRDSNLRQHLKKLVINGYRPTVSLVDNKTSYYPERNPKLDRLCSLTLTAPKISRELISEVLILLAEAKFSLVEYNYLSKGENSQKCLVVRILMRGELTDLENFKIQLSTLSDKFSVDMFYQKEIKGMKDFSLLVIDMDSTLINFEVIDELAREANVLDEVSAITESAMRGDINFKQSLMKRLNLLANTDIKVLDRVFDRIQLNPGAERLVSTLKNSHYKIAIISGGFSFFADRIKENLDIDYAFANVLETKDGLLTGKLTGKLIDGEAKAAIVKKLSDKHDIKEEKVISIGDGANDIPMLKVSGLGIAFRAKLLLSKNADCVITQGGLDSVLYFFGWRDI